MFSDVSNVGDRRVPKYGTGDNARYSNDVPVRVMTLFLKPHGSENIEVHFSLLSFNDRQPGVDLAFRFTHDASLIMGNVPSVNWGGDALGQRLNVAATFAHVLTPSPDLIFAVQQQRQITMMSWKITCRHSRRNSSQPETLRVRFNLTNMLLEINFLFLNEKSDGPYWNGRAWKHHYGHHVHCPRKRTLFTCAQNLHGTCHSPHVRANATVGRVTTESTHVIDPKNKSLTQATLALSETKHAPNITLSHHISVRMLTQMNNSTSNQTDTVSRRNLRTWVALRKFQSHIFSRPTVLVAWLCRTTRSHKTEENDTRHSLDVLERVVNEHLLRLESPFTIQCNSRERGLLVFLPNDPDPCCLADRRVLHVLPTRCLRWYRNRLLPRLRHTLRHTFHTHIPMPSICIGALRGARETFPSGTPSFCVVREKWRARRCEFSITSAILLQSTCSSSQWRSRRTAPACASRVIIHPADADLWLRILFGRPCGCWCQSQLSLFHQQELCQPAARQWSSSWSNLMMSQVRRWHRASSAQRIREWCKRWSPSPTCQLFRVRQRRNTSLFAQRPAWICPV